jgi:hypothetical protein
MEIKDLLNAGSDDHADGKKESPLKSLETDLKFYNDSLKEVALEIMSEGISSYPVFIAHQHEVKIGETIFDRNELHTEWSVNASTMEEFIDRGLILPEKKNKFMEQYKDPHGYMCILVIVPEGANFVFYPYR